MIPIRPVHRAALHRLFGHTCSIFVPLCALGAFLISSLISTVELRAAASDRPPKTHLPQEIEMASDMRRTTPAIAAMNSVVRNAGLDKVTRLERENHAAHSLYMVMYDDDGHRYGTIRSPWFCCRMCIQIYDRRGKPLAVATKQIFAWGTRIVIHDAKQQNEVYIVRKRVFHSPLRVVNRYEVKNSRYEILANSDKFELFSINIRLIDPNTKLTSFLFRKSKYAGLAEIAGFDKWKIRPQHDQELVSRLVPLVIAAMKTKADINSEHRHHRHNTQTLN